MINFPFFNSQQLNLDWIMKKLQQILRFMPVDTGTVGDVLQRKAEGAAWEHLSTVALDIDGITYESSPDGADEVPIYDVSATANRKTTISDILALVTMAVTSVAGKTGAVTLDKNDVGLGNVANVAQYSASNPPPYPVTSVAGKTGAVTLNKSDVGLGNVANVAQYSASNPPPYPVTSVNGQTGAVTISAGVSSVNGNTGAVTVDEFKFYGSNPAAFNSNDHPHDLGYAFVNTDTVGGTYPDSQTWGVIMMFPISNNELQFFINNVGFWKRMYINSVWSSWITV